ncbi:MAG: GIY-YIG nuclease family protein [Clostridia bacterium]|nr:GIY-YIG nuclease family protein [Clostridia bacterium]
MAYDKTIQMFIFEGNPNGRIMCELSNWNGIVYKISRNEINKFSERKESGYTGIYFLFGKNDDNSETVYIGEAERLLDRLKQHIQDNEYWNNCVVVTSKDNALNKAHVKYLENAFFSFAKESNRFDITNRNTPTRSSISEYDEATLKEFIDNAKLLVNALGYKAFDLLSDENLSETKIKFYIKAARGADAIGSAVADGFVVFKGSKIASSVTNSISGSIVKFREKLMEKKVINSDFEFVNDYIFTSPSLAAAVVMGRNANGRTEWKTEDKKTFAQIEGEGL